MTSCPHGIPFVHPTLYCPICLRAAMCSEGKPIDKGSLSVTEKTTALENDPAERMRWMEAKLLHAQAVLKMIATLRRGNELTGVPEGWSEKGHAAAEGLALGWLTGMPNGLASRLRR